MVGFYDVTKLFPQFPKYRVMASESHSYHGDSNIIRVVVSDLRTFRFVVALPTKELIVSHGLSSSQEVEITRELVSKFDQIKKKIR